jgi:hypothetical protein
VAGDWCVLGMAHGWVGSGWVGMEGVMVGMMSMSMVIGVIDHS